MLNVLGRSSPTFKTANEAAHADAFDYLAKLIDPAEFLRTVANAAKLKVLDDERRRLAEENERHREELD